MMNKNTYLTVMAVSFAVGTLVHLSRLIWGWHIQIGSWVAPKWFSALAMLIAGYFAWVAFKLVK